MGSWKACWKKHRINSRFCGLAAGETALQACLVAEGVWDKEQCSRVLREISGFVGKMAQYRLMQENHSYVMTHDRESGLLNYQPISGA